MANNANQLSEITVDRALIALGEHLSIKSKALSAFKKAGMMNDKHAKDIKNEYEQLTQKLSELARSQVCPNCGTVLWNHPAECRKK